MSILGGYSLHLYCDDPQHRERHPSQISSCDADIAGWETFSEARKDARSIGWIFHRDHTVTCPECAGRKKP